MMVKKTTQFKKKKSGGNSKKRAKEHRAKKGKAPKQGPALDAECFFYKEKGHWKRNCPQVLSG